MRRQLWIGIGWAHFLNGEIERPTVEWAGLRVKRGAGQDELGPFSIFCRSRPKCDGEAIVKPDPNDAITKRSGFSDSAAAKGCWNYGGA